MPPLIPGVNTEQALGVTTGGSKTKNANKANVELISILSIDFVRKS